MWSRDGQEQTYEWNAFAYYFAGSYEWNAFTLLPRYTRFENENLLETFSNDSLLNLFFYIFSIFFFIASIDLNISDIFVVSSM